MQLWDKATLSITSQTLNTNKKGHLFNLTTHKYHNKLHYCKYRKQKIVKNCKNQADNFVFWQFIKIWKPAQLMLAASVVKLGDVFHNSSCFASVVWALVATVHTTEVINDVRQPAHLEDDGKAAFQPVTPDLLFTSQTHFSSLCNIRPTVYPPTYCYVTVVFLCGCVYMCLRQAISQVCVCVCVLLQE